MVPAAARFLFRLGRRENGRSRVCARSWYVPGKVKVGYEINFTRCFYQSQPLRAPGEIWTDIRALERESEGGVGRDHGRSGPICLGKCNADGEQRIKCA